MRTPFAIAAALLLGGASTAAMAQTVLVVPTPGAQDVRPPAPITQMNDIGERSMGQFPATTRADQRATLRRQMAMEGFQDIRISDATFFVQARTPDGRDVLMVVRPTGQEQQVGRMTRPERQRDRAYGYYPNALAIPDFDSQNRETASADRSATSGTGTEEMDTTGAVSGTDMLGAARVRSELRTRGFSNISDWAEENGTYTATADWYGEQVDVKVDARTGDVLQPSTMQPGQVRAFLDERGFGNVRDIRQGDGMIEARADRGGTSFQVQIDPRQARIEDFSTGGQGQGGQGGGQSG